MMNSCGYFEYQYYLKQKNTHYLQRSLAGHPNGAPFLNWSSSCKKQILFAKQHQVQNTDVNLILLEIGVM
jgi:hypothetical protein